MDRTETWTNRVVRVFVAADVDTKVLLPHPHKLKIIQRMAQVRRAIRARTNCLDFDPAKTLSVGRLKELVELALRAPSSFNAQPYKIVVVHSQEQKQLLSHCMIGRRNARRVADASATFVFLSGNARVGDLIRLETNSGRLRTPEQATRLATSVNAFAGPSPFSDSESSSSSTIRSSLEAFLSSMHVSDVKAQAVLTAFDAASPNIDVLAAPTRALASGALRGGSSFTQSPFLDDPVTWAVKSTMPAATTLVYAAQSWELSSAMMEGFDPDRVRAVVEAPSSYGVPVIVSVGICLESTFSNGSSSERFAVDEASSFDVFEG